MLLPENSLVFLLAQCGSAMARSSWTAAIPYTKTKGSLFFFLPDAGQQRQGPLGPLHLHPYTKTKGSGAELSDASRLIARDCEWIGNRGLAMRVAEGEWPSVHFFLCLFQSLA